VPSLLLCRAGHQHLLVDAWQLPLVCWLLPLWSRVAILEEIVRQDNTRIKGIVAANLSKPQTTAVEHIKAANVIRPLES
jgi:hypothetical protein